MDKGSGLIGIVIALAWVCFIIIPAIIKALKTSKTTKGEKD